MAWDSHYLVQRNRINGEGETMQTPYFVAFLATALVLGIGSTQLPERGAGVPSWSVTERAAQLAGTQSQRAELLPIVPAALLTTVTGRPLSCTEIRSIDEVELLTDESYCR
ncbi:MAG TPA: hypothetical protein VIG34_10990 [Xanthobacteraceae bacterium]